VDTNNKLEIDLLTICKERFLSVPYGRAKAYVPVLYATSSISEAFNKVKFSECLNSHNSFEEQESANTAKWPPHQLLVFAFSLHTTRDMVLPSKLHKSTELLKNFSCSVPVKWWWILKHHVLYGAVLLNFNDEHIRIKNYIHIVLTTFQQFYECTKFITTLVKITSTLTI
jgi:hypothetical protein